MGPFALPVLALCPLGGVRPQQVMGPVALRGDFLRQVDRGELAQLRVSGGNRDADQGGDGRGTEFRPRVQTDRAEQLLLVGGQRAVRPGEHRPDVDQLIFVCGERVKTVLLADKLADQFRQRQVRAPRGALGDNAQRQWQVAAEPGYADGRGVLAVDPLIPDNLREQADGVVGRQDIERHTCGSFSGHQAGQAAPASYNYKAPSGARQEPSHLAHRCHVVNDDEHALITDHGPEQGGPLVDVNRDEVRRHAERAEELIERLFLDQRQVRAVPAHVDVQVAVGEVAANPVGPVERERRLADAGSPRDSTHRDRSRGGCRVFGRPLGKQCIESRKERFAINEDGRTAGQLTRYRQRIRLRAVEMDPTVDRTSLYDSLTLTRELDVKALAPLSLQLPSPQVLCLGNQADRGAIPLTCNSWDTRVVPRSCCIILGDGLVLAYRSGRWAT